MRTSIPNILRAVHSATWAILPEKMDAMLEFLELRASGVAFSDDELAARGISAANGRPQPRVAGQTAVLPLYGVIGQHLGIEMQISGGTSTEAFGRAFDEAINNPDVGAIVIDASSPGGSTFGVPELAAKIFSARDKGKRIIAVANAEMNSAAYWICAAAHEIVATPSAFVGSIGVFTMHTDTSGAEEKAGIKRTVISAGRYKGEAAPGVPLTDEALAAKQAMVSEAYAMFAGDIARFRATTLAAVKSGYGEGRSISAKQALAAGMIDRIAPLDDVLAELAGRAGGNANAMGSRRIAAINTDELMAAVPKARAGESFAHYTDRVLALIAERFRAEGEASDDTVCPDCGATLVDGVCPDVETHPESIPTDDEGPEARGRAREGDAVPPATSPAPQARSSTMSDKDTAAERAALIKAETDRQNEIRTLCAENQIEADAMNGYLAAGMTMEAVSADILRRKREERAKAPVIRSQSGGLTRVHDVNFRADEDPRRGFASPRDFNLAVIQNAGLRERSQISDERLRPLAQLDENDRQSAGEIAYLLPRAFNPASLRAAAGSDEQGNYADRFGGFLQPTQIMPGLLTVPFEGDPTAGLTQPVPMTAPIVKFNARTDKEHSTSVSGGFTVTRRPETVAGTSSRMEMEQVELKASSLFGLAYASEEVLTDSPISFAALIDSGFRDQFPAAVLNEKLNGKGGTEYQGVITAPCAISIAKETGQAADTIVYNNVIKMASRSWGFGQAVWIANYTTRPQLSVLSIPVGTGGTLIYQPSPGAGFPDMLYGRPIFYTEFASAIGDLGDLMLINWSQYLEGLYQPLQSAESVHVRFVNHERAFKLWVRNCGAPWWRSALTPKNGDTLSPIVTLAAR